MPTSKPLKTALIMARVSEAEKQRLDQLAAERNVTLSDALRGGAYLFLEDAKKSRRRSHAPTT